MKHTGSQITKCRAEKLRHSTFLLGSRLSVTDSQHGRHRKKCERNLGREQIASGGWGGGAVCLNKLLLRVRRVPGGGGGGGGGTPIHYLTGMCRPTGSRF